MDLRPITSDYAVAPQIDPGEMPAIAEAGYKSVMCNRPDGEELGQPDYADVEAAAQAAGLEIRWVPIISGRVTPEDMAAFRAALEDMPKPMLAYCRTGTRCTMLWSIARHGDLPDAEILSLTGQAGYDMSGLLAQLSGQG